MVLKSLLHLFYPELCVACGGGLVSNETYICLDCQLNLPKTGFHKYSGNPADQIFWGRFPLQRASSFLYFEKAAGVQKILHHIKYLGGKKIAKMIGELYGDELKSIGEYDNIDVIIPVPLHKSKLISRGYNQSEWFALGLSETIKVPVQSNNLIRIYKSETQTRKTRYKRWQNVSDIFAVAHPDLLKNKHILLVDDVVTTGATLEACAQQLLALNCGIKISIATIAFAS